MLQNSSLGAEPDTMPYSPKHLCQGKLKLVASTVPQLYSLKRSLSKLHCKYYKIREEMKRTHTFFQHHCKIVINHHLSASPSPLTRYLDFLLPALAHFLTVGLFTNKVLRDSHQIFLTRCKGHNNNKYAFCLTFLVCFWTLKNLHLTECNLLSASPTCRTPRHTFSYSWCVQYKDWSDLSCNQRDSSHRKEKACKLSASRSPTGLRNRFLYLTSI